MESPTQAGRGAAGAETNRHLVGSGNESPGPGQHPPTGRQPADAKEVRGQGDRGLRLQAGVDRRYAVVMLAAAATFGIASYLHLDGRVPLGIFTITGERFSRASVPEAIIGVVLAAGAVVVVVAPRRALVVAVSAVGFAALGVLAGLGFVLTPAPGRI